MRNAGNGFLGTDAWHDLPNLNLGITINSLNPLLLLDILIVPQLTLHVLGMKKELSFPCLRRAVGTLPSPLLLHAINE